MKGSVATHPQAGFCFFSNCCKKNSILHNLNVIKGINEKHVSDYRSELDAAASLHEKDSKKSHEQFENLRKAIKEKMEIPSHADIKEGYEDSSSSYKRAIVANLLRRALEDNDNKSGNLIKNISEIESSDISLNWESDSKKPEIRFKQVVHEVNQSPVELLNPEELRKKKLEKTKEVVVYVNLHNGTTPKENTVLVVVMKQTPDGRIDYANPNIPGEAVNYVSTEQDVSEIFKSSKELKPEERKTARKEILAQDRLLDLIQGHATVKDYCDRYKKDTGTNIKDFQRNWDKAIDKEEEEGSIERKRKNERIKLLAERVGDQYPKLLEQTLSVETELIEAAEVKIKALKEKHDAIKNSPEQGKIFEQVLTQLGYLREDNPAYGYLISVLVKDFELPEDEIKKLVAEMKAKRASAAPVRNRPAGSTSSSGGGRP